MSVVLKCVCDLPSKDLNYSRNVNPKSWFILSVLFLAGW